MLIVSKFHDYYDTATAFGVDKETVYKREYDQRLFKERGHIFSEVTFWRYHLTGITDKDYYVLTNGLIGYCGELIPFAWLHKTEDRHRKHEIDCEIYFHPDSLEARLGDENMVEEKKGKGYWRLHGHKISRKQVHNLFNQDRYSEYRDKFREEQVPLFAVYLPFLRSHHMSFDLNPRLQDFEFYKLKDPFTAFQDIYMYISGVLGNPEKNLVEISDKDKLHEKGFNDRSFKQDPGTKKRKGKRK